MLLFLSEFAACNSSVFYYYKLGQFDKTEPAVSMRVSVVCEECFLIGEEKAFDKTQHSLMLKTL